TQSLWHHCPQKNRNCPNSMKASRNSSPTFCRVEITSSRRRRISCRKSGKCLPRYRRFPAHAFPGSLAADRPASLCLRPRTKLSKPLQSLAQNVLPGGLLPLRSADYTHLSCPRKRVSSNHWRSLAGITGCPVKPSNDNESQNGRSTQNSMASSSAAFASESG